MNKVISTKDRLFMAVVGPSGSGKTDLILKMLTSNTFYPKFASIIYFYQHEQPKYQQIASQEQLNSFTKTDEEICVFQIKSKS